MIVRLLAGLALVLVAACSPAATPVPPTSALPSPPVASDTPSPSGEPSIEASPSPTIAGCPIPPTTGELPSNTVTGMNAVTIGTVDRMTFTFGEPVDLPVEPMGRLAVVAPPFTHGTTGDPVDVVGEHFVEVVFTGLALSDEQGTPTFEGQRDARYGLPAIKQAVVFDESEGQVGVIVGYTGDGCPTLGGDPGAGTVTIEVPHPIG
jgi:hypothetical protein